MNLIYLATLIFSFICIIVTTVYLYTLIKRFTNKFNSKVNKPWMRRAFPLSIAALIIALIILYNPFVLFVLYFLMSSIFVDIINYLIKRFVKNECTPIKIWSKIYTGLLIPLLFSIGIMVYGHINIMNIQQTYYRISTDKSIREEGYRIGLIADLHFGSSIDLEGLDAMCDEVSATKPDIVILCGDIVDESTTRDEMIEVFKRLGNIKNTMGIYFVYGNHDCQTYVAKPSYTKEELADTITENNIIILQDDIYTFNNELAIIGRSDASFSMNTSRANIDYLLSKISKDSYAIVLDHQPTEYELNASSGTDLLLSGHTHAGQFWPLNIVLELVPFNDGVYGKYKIDNMNAIITSGVSGWAFPFKTSAPAEYVIIDVKPQ